MKLTKQLEDLEVSDQLEEVPSAPKTNQMEVLTKSQNTQRTIVLVEVALQAQ